MSWRKDGTLADRPPSVAPGPLITGLTLAFGYLLDHVWWLGVIGSISRPYRATIAAVLIALGAWLLWIGIGAFNRLKTDFLPTRPSKALVTNSVYAGTRNPIWAPRTMTFLACDCLRPWTDGRL
jgi:protein-S-isoprenylcysteine O-methyltransferase Ste14